VAASSRARAAIVIVVGMTAALAGGCKGNEEAGSKPPVPASVEPQAKPATTPPPTEQKETAHGAWSIADIRFRYNADEQEQDLAVMLKATNHTDQLTEELKTTSMESPVDLCIRLYDETGFEVASATFTVAADPGKSGDVSEKSFVDRKHWEKAQQLKAYLAGHGCATTPAESYSEVITLDKQGKILGTELPNPVAGVKP
jgi:hypothetical protein